MTARPATHERLASDDETKGSSDRAFGLVFAAVFTIAGLWPLAGGGPVRIWALGLAVAFLAAVALRPKLLAPLNRIWTRLGRFLHCIANFVILALLFYLVITPMGLALRLLGKDPLRLRFEPGVRSYWIERRPPGPAPETIKHQF